MNPMGLAGAGLLALGVFLGVYFALTGGDTPLHKAYGRYALALERDCRLLYLKVTGEQIAKRQLAGLGALLVAFLFTNEWLLVGVMAFGAIIPKLWLNGQLDERRKKLDAQLDAFLTTLANALKVSPSLGDALGTTAGLMRSPIKEDLEFVLKEYKLGTPLDQALLNMSQRAESRSFNSALTTILIGRQTGGDLPKILERSAATLREMARLEGVVRTKTAEGKGQAYVLGGVPFFIVIAINGVDPNWLRPLTTSATGYVVIGVAAVLWIVAVLAARKILDVDV